MEDVLLGKRVLDDLGIRPSSILFACKSHHSGRCLRTLRQYWPKVKLSVLTFDATYDGYVVSKDTWYENPISRSRVYGEYLRTQAYAELGQIAAVAS